jgi:glycosyltransferase involved in cell wall biosynthesis
MMDKKISVVITSFNQSKYLIEAIESVIHQTSRAHEIIVADDCSSDGSVDVIKNYMQKYPDLVIGVFNEKNRGIPQNRNSGLGKVTGDFVFILDGDDRFLPKNVEKMKGALKRDESLKCIYSNLNFIDAEGKFLHVRDKGEQPSGDIFFHIAVGKFGILRNMIIDISLLRDIGFFDENFPRYDGFELTLRLAKICKIGYIFEPLAEYRMYPTSDSKGLKAVDHLNDLDGIYRKMRPWLSDLSKPQREEIRIEWSKRLIRYFMADLKENPNKCRQRFLPLHLLFKRYLKIQDFVGARKVLKEFF